MNVLFKPQDNSNIVREREKEREESEGEGGGGGAGHKNALPDFL